MSLASLVVARSFRYVTLRYVTIRFWLSCRFVLRIRYVLITLYVTHTPSNFAVADFTPSPCSRSRLSSPLPLSFFFSLYPCLFLWVPHCVGAVSCLTKCVSVAWSERKERVLPILSTTPSLTLSPTLPPATTSSRRREASLALINHSLSTKHFSHNKLNKRKLNKIT